MSDPACAERPGQYDPGREQLGMEVVTWRGTEDPTAASIIDGRLECDFRVRGFPDRSAVLGRGVTFWNAARENRDLLKWAHLLPWLRPTDSTYKDYMA